MMLNRLRPALILFALALTALPARAFETAAAAAWVYDMTTGTVLMDKNADQPVPPASMSKLMTINMLFEALKDGRVTMDTTFAVSERAVQMTREGGSTMMLQREDRPSVKDLIRGIIVNSGNDASIVVAEGLAGTEEAFARQMTERARALGMTATNLVNSSGWPDPAQRMSMRDLGILGKRLIEEFPEYYPIFAETEYLYKGRSPDNRFNRNPLLGLGIGVDDRRIVFAFSGLPSDQARAEEGERIVNWAFRQFSEKTVAKAGVRVAEAEVHLGDASTVGLVPAEDIRLLIPALAQDGLKAEVVYNGPLIAPVSKGDAVAEMIIFSPDLPDRRVALVAEADVGKAGFVKRLTSAAEVLYARYLGSPAS
ncbi:MAG: D-alanyl-D-alanine carboxypeptidase [Rhodobacterales bacterium 32-66-9]|nr:MAG: D-alanyl-D-alanine carboxypeptidase [Rhodobacterales bacterium 32-66-9]